MKPVPQFTRKWGGKVCQTTEADLEGVEYDKSIPVSAIFWLKKSGEAERRLVATSRCTNCRNQNLDCVRTDPCNVCRKRGLRCSYQGYIHLRRKGEPVKITIPRKEDRLTSVNLGRNVKKKRMVEKTPQPDRTPMYESAYLTPPRKTKNGKSIPLDNVKTLETSKRKEAPGIALGDEASPKKRRALAGTTTKKGNISWKRADMSSLNSQNCVAKIRVPKGPYIWSEDYTELLGAVPLLSLMNNGVSADVGPSPMIYIDNAFWTGTWSRSNIIELKTARTFSCSESSMKPELKESDDSVDNSIPVTAGQEETSCPPAEPDEEVSDSDGELAYPEEEEDEELQCLENPGTNDLKRGDVCAGVLGSFPPRLSDDSVSMYLAHLAAASSVVHPKEVPPVDVPLPVVDRKESMPSMYVPEGYPDEIATLVKAYEGGMPVSVIADTSWTHFPFDINERCKYAVLGFFHIVSIATKTDSLPSITSNNGTTRVRGRVTWSFTLYWTQGGPSEPDSPIDLDGRHRSLPPIPWWLSDECELFPPPPSTRWLIEPFYARANIIASAVMRDVCEDRHGRANASYRSWFCVQCGKLNTANWFSSYKCSFCRSKAKERRKRLIYPRSVRNKERFIPMWEPSAQVPNGVTTSMEACENRFRRFTYTIRSTSRKKVEKGKGKAIDLPVVDIPADAAELRVELIFPGNRAELEQQADSLFVSFQEDVRMHFERTGSKATAGVYTFRVSPNESLECRKPDGFSTWKMAPDCINEVGQTMADYARNSSKCEMDHRKLHLSVMAWLGESPVKTEIQAYAEEHAVILMCLGADLDIVFAKPGEERPEKKSRKGRPKTVKGLQKLMENVETEISRAGINAEIWGDGGGRETNKALTASDRLRITLTHGSILIISGCNIELTVIRSDFAILIKLHDEQ